MATKTGWKLPDEDVEEADHQALIVIEDYERGENEIVYRGGCLCGWRDNFWYYFPQEPTRRAREHVEKTRR
jgi:hypothetical protein